MSDPNSQSDSSAPAPVLSYATLHAKGRTVGMGRYPMMEFGLAASLLDSAGIQHGLVGSHVDGLGMPELVVNEKDACAAREVLSRMDGQLEPADDPADMTPVLGEDGRPFHLAVVASFEHIRDLREAAAILESSGLRIYAPILRRRSPDSTEKPRPLVLKVPEEEREVAVSLLETARAEDADNEDPRCPRCNSWRVCPVPQLMANVKAFFGMGPWPQKQTDCLACRYRGAPQEFGVRP